MIATLDTMTSHLVVGSAEAVIKEKNDGFGRPDFPNEIQVPAVHAAKTQPSFGRFEFQ